MQTIADRRSILMGAVGLGCAFALAASPVAKAQEKVTAQSLIDRQLIPGTTHYKGSE